MKKKGTEWVVKSVVVPADGVFTTTGEVRFLGAVPTFLVKRGENGEGDSRHRAFEIIFCSRVIAEKRRGGG